MANAPIGNNFIEGPLGVVQLTFDSVDLGKTIDEASLEFIEDIKDIFYAQDGTQPADKIPTGQAYQITCKFGQPTWARLEKLLRGLTVVGNNALAGRNVYISGKDTFAKELKVARVDSDGVASTNPLYIMTCPEAMAMVTNLGSFGPDSQREIEVTFYIFYNDTISGYWYAGYASSLGL